ncbi:hypothetical protein J3893_001525 [Salmonella enterica subsp. enterica serovar Nigeria]|nr:hypothetical protein [Salmonella enterica subsp. enterica serovar Nigeria]
MYEPGSHRPLAVIDGNKLTLPEYLEPKVYWYHNDHLGTPHSLTDINGEEVYRCQFDAYGNLVEDGLLMQFVLGTMFIVLPVFWIGAVSWAGIQTGNSLDGILKTVQTNVTPKMRNKKQSSYGYDDDEN